MRPIDADNVINHYKKNYCNECNSWQGTKCKMCSIDEFIKSLENAPAVAMKYGVWEPKTRAELYGYIPELTDYNHRIDAFVCSVCGFHAITNDIEEPILSNYCPHCGAKMKKGIRS